MSHTIRALVAAALLLTPAAVASQDAADAPANADATGQDGLLTQAELENLVAPVALFPDTLLIQILVAATQPMDVVKSDRLLQASEGEDPDIIKAAVEAEGYDESVEVLAVAFPEVIEDMALHLEWTETMGDAMLAQSDDVMAAIQTMRSQAINTGALVSSPEQSVEVAEDDTVVIQPADPDVVYVPQYDPKVVYDDNLVADALTAGVIAFGTFTLIDAIFDDDDDWDDYWGCRNCAGWDGGPIYRNPDIDIDVDGNVNIGNDIDIGSGNIGDRLPDGGENIGDRLPEGGETIGDRLPGDGSWSPDEDRAQAARDKIAERRDEGGASTLPLTREDSQGDALRAKLSGASGAEDISRPGANIDREALRNTRPGAGAAAAGAAGAAAAIGSGLSKPSKAVKKPEVKKPSVKKPAAAKAPIKKASKTKQVKKPKAISKKSSGHKVKKASNRGKKAKGKKRG